MPEKDLTTWGGGLATWLLALGMAFGGGAVNWYSKVRREYGRAFNIIELIGEIFTSGFAGLVCSCSWPSWSSRRVFARQPAGVGGHMATRLLFIIERAIEARLEGLTKKGNAKCSKPYSVLGSAACSAWPPKF